ncbi:Glycosyl transferase family 2 [uncultured archaeon]|nr:Glycosyl transferase family 2 [uncultured archaeon]
MSSIILPDTSLCAIVRDEKMNPAGGIERFVDSHVPYVEQAVIADTGSVDGTREILEEMQAKYSNLKVVDIPFTGYADSRNKALKYVKTKRVLVLDADELLTHEKPQNDWDILKEFIETNFSKAYRFFFEVILPERIIPQSTSGHTLRLFDKDARFSFKNQLWEKLETRGKISDCWIDNIQIKHFVPSRSSTAIKWNNWYLDSFSGTKGGEISDEERVEYWKIPPSMREGFQIWKNFNPKRNNYL